MLTSPPFYLHLVLESIELKCFDVVKDFSEQTATRHSNAPGMKCLIHTNEGQNKTTQQPFFCCFAQGEHTMQFQSDFSPCWAPLKAAPPAKNLSSQNWRSATPRHFDGKSCPPSSGRHQLTTHKKKDTVAQCKWQSSSFLSTKKMTSV